MKENVLERNARMDTDRKIADFRVKQQMDYAFKMKYARIRAWEFYNHPDVAGNCYVAVGGLDSITLLLFLRSIGIDVPAVSVSSLEDKSIQRVHKQLGVQPAALVPGRKPEAARNSRYCIFCNRLGRRTRMQDRAHLRRGIRRPHH